VVRHLRLNRWFLGVWLLLVAALSGQTIEELRARLQQADIDKAVLVERSRNSNQTSTVLIALIGAMPALYAAYLTYLGNRMVKKASEMALGAAAKSAARGEVLANDAQAYRAKTTERNEVIAGENAAQNAQIAAQLSDEHGHP
jgi:hypothetical protein